MFSLISNPLSIALTLSTAFGILVHDVKIDQVAALSTLPVAAVLGYSAYEYGIKVTEHIHAERASFGVNGSQPATQPRGDDRKYIAQKKFSSQAYGSEYQWPSV